MTYYKSRQNPSLAQVKIEEAKRELVSGASVFDKGWGIFAYFFYSNAVLFAPLQAALDSQLEMKTDFK